jgi:hypothetical protein
LSASSQQPIQVSDYIIETARDTLENWRSEQLIWQVAGLAFFLFISSRQSKKAMIVVVLVPSALLFSNGFLAIVERIKLETR